MPGARHAGSPIEAILTHLPANCPAICVARTPDPACGGSSPRAGIRQEISPTILAVATVLVILSIALLTTVELLRRRSERLRGMSPG